MYRFEVVNPDGVITYESTDKTTAFQKLATAFVCKDVYHTVMRIKAVDNYDGTMIFHVIHYNGYRWNITTERI